MGTKKITISQQRSKCIGCGACVSASPKYWKMNNNDGLADLIDGEASENGIVTAKVDEVDYEQNKKAADVCPVDIIRVN